jgi:hypothetical protein
MVLVASAVPGRQLTGAFCDALRISHSRCHGVELAVAGAWLAHFQEVTARGSGPVDLLPHEDVAGLDRLAREARGSDHAARTVLDRAHRVHEVLARHEAPRSAVHGNFSADQVLVDPRTAQVSGVLGWRRATTRGEPLVDVGRFAVTHPAHGGPWSSLGAVHGATVLAGRGPRAEQGRRFIREALVRLGLPDDLWYAVAWAATASLLAGGSASHDGRQTVPLTRLLARTPDPTAGR